MRARSGLHMAAQPSTQHVWRASSTAAPASFRLRSGSLRSTVHRYSRTGSSLDSDPQASAVDAIQVRAAELADRLSLDFDRVLRWAVVKAIGWDFGRDKTLVLDEAARVRDWRLRLMGPVIMDARRPRAGS